jgi:hypothetical protein
VIRLIAAICRFGWADELNQLTLSCADGSVIVEGERGTRGRGRHCSKTRIRAQAGGCSIVAENQPEKSCTAGEQFPIGTYRILFQQKRLSETLNSIRTESTGQEEVPFRVCTSVLASNNLMQP